MRAGVRLRQDASVQPLDPATARAAPDPDRAAVAERAAGYEAGRAAALLTAAGLTDVTWHPCCALILATATAAKP
jgi:rhodanese-related sulfurtransferase